jgi:hypothetical protein
MASHYVSLTRGTEGSKYSDFTTGTSSAATDLFEFRVLDGVTPTRVEMIKALEAFERLSRIRGAAGRYQGLISRRPEFNRGLVGIRPALFL